LIKRSMPHYDTSDYRANISELDPCLAAKIRLSKNRCCNWKIVCFAIIILLLFIIGALLLFKLDWNNTDDAKFPSDQSPNELTPSPQSFSHVPISISMPSEKLQSVNTFGRVFATCDEYFKNGFTQNGVYQLQGPTGYKFLAQCVMNEDDGKAWMVMQQRTSGELPFWNRTYDEYIQGFGFPTGDHWLGLAHIRNMIKAGYNLQLKVEIKGDRCEKNLDNLYYTGIWKFELGSSEKGYRLRLSDMLTGNFTRPLFTMDDSNGLPFSKMGSVIADPVVNCLEALHLG